MGLFWLIIFTTLAHWGKTQRYTNAKVRQMSDPFAFLVTGEKLPISTQTKIESLDILLRFDLDSVLYKAQKAEIDALLDRFQKLSFFTLDASLKNEYLSFFYIGQENYNNMAKNIDTLMGFKQTTECKNHTNCQNLALEVNIDDFKRVKANLQYRFNKIDPVNWTPLTIVSHREQQNTLLSFISVFDEFSANMFEKTDRMLTAVEALSNKNFPEDLLALVPAVCNNTGLFEGEAYKVLTCTGCTKGYQCKVQVDTPAVITVVTRMLPVSYAGIHLKGNEEQFTFARTAELELKQLDCDMTEGNIEYPSCQIHEFPPHCKKALDDNDVRGAISYCEFSKTTLQVAQSLPEGGVLVQDLAIEALQIAAGGAVITQPPPLIIYSPRDVHVKHGDEEYVYAPSDSVTEQKILQSMLTTEDFYKLISVVYWREFGRSFQVSDIIRYILVAMQLIILPLTIYGVVMAIKNAKKYKKVSMGKMNYKQNKKEYLLQRVK